MMQIVKVEEAIGLPLAHDITEIRPGEFKGPAFHRGYVVKDYDVDHLRRLGKDHLYILKTELNQLHEDDAVREIANALCGDGVAWEGLPREGKLALKATRDGLLKVDVDVLTGFNKLGEVMCATRHTDSLVIKGDKVAATRAIPLLIDRSVIIAAVEIAKQSQGVLRVLPIKKANVGVLITGNEVYHGRIQDRFEPVIRKKVEALQGTILDVVFLPDDDDRIATAALDLVKRGADVLITTGGMSVDPDDRTRFGLLRAGARDMLYGAAVLPGAMFMIAQLKDVPVLGIPACGMHAIATVFDLIYPRVLAGERMTRNDIARLGHGGMCLQCEACRYPNCPFGKAS
ncbi:MAG: molybdopterin-binding protein [Pseudomonadota bacterium]